MKRDIYDSLGMEGLNENKKKQRKQQNSNFSDFNFDDFDMQDFPDFAMDDYDPPTSKDEIINRTPDIKEKILITLEDIYIGAVVEREVERQIICRSCQGCGCFEDTVFSKCLECKGIYFISPSLLFFLHEFSYRNKSSRITYLSADLSNSLLFVYLPLIITHLKAGV